MRSAHATAPVDWLATALWAAELGEPLDLDQAPPSLFMDLVAALPELRTTVPYAALRLLERFVADRRDSVRVSVARALPWFIELYPQAVDRMLLTAACDPARRVRDAAARALADLLESTSTPTELIERWRWHSVRARQVLDEARALLPAPVGTR